MATGKSPTINTDYEPVDSVLVIGEWEAADWWTLCFLHDELLSQADMNIKYNVHVGLVAQLRADHPPAVDAVRGNLYVGY